MNSHSDPYALPAKALELLADPDLRERELERVSCENDIGMEGLGHGRERELLVVDAHADTGHSQLCQALRYLTLCVGGAVRRAARCYSYGAKHRAEELTIDGMQCYVSNGAMIAATLMCGGEILPSGINAYLGMKQPRRCGNHCYTGCGRLIAYSRKQLCHVCRTKGYRRSSGKVNNFETFHGASVHISRQFPPSSDIL